MRRIFITGIGTDVGKTVVSAIVTEALNADYWKPVQTGTCNSSDSDFVKNVISNTKSIIHPEQYTFPEPLSPHAAAELDGKKVLLSNIKLPKTENTLVIEGAGGVMVPLNDNEFMIDLIEKFEAETIVVVQNYLGSINHSLLTIETLVKRNINILGLVINGPVQKSSENIILNYTGLKCIGRVFNEQEINKEVVLKYAKLFTLI